MNDRYFSIPDNETWCRMGGNGSVNVSQIMPLVKFTSDKDSFLDVGCGSGTTIDAINLIKRKVNYKGIENISSRLKWLRKKYPKRKFANQDARHLKEKNKSWDIVWSRHVVDHLDSFENAITEHCRVAKKRVICILWYSLNDSEKDSIKHITYEKVYEDEYLNQYSRDKVKKFLDSLKGFYVKEFREEVSWQGDKQGKGADTIIVLERK